MKDQYFGDVSDYVKYGLLRRLAADGVSVFVSWMLTPADDRTDGRHIQYLTAPQRFRKFDAPLFDALADAIAAGRRDVATVERKNLIPGARFQRTVLADSHESRGAYFDELVRASHGADLVFLDPDNGLQVASARPGRRGSAKYVYWEEVRRIYETGASLLVYQHFPRVERRTFLDSLVARVRDELATSAFALRTARVAFLVIPSHRHREILSHSLATAVDAWAPLLALHEAGAAARGMSIPDV